MEEKKYKVAWKNKEKNYGTDYSVHTFLLSLINDLEDRVSALEYERKKKNVRDILKGTL